MKNSLYLITFLFVCVNAKSQSILDSIEQLIAQKEFKNAELLVDKSLAQNAENGKASYYKGLILMEHKSNGLAMGYFKKAIIYPFEEQFMAYNEIAFLYMLDRKFEEAYEAVSKAMRMNKQNHKGHYVRGRIQAKENNFPAALASINKAIRLNNEIAEYYVGRAKVHHITGNKPAACIDFTQAKQLGYQGLDSRIEDVCN